MMRKNIVLLIHLLLMIRLIVSNLMVIIVLKLLYLNRMRWSHARQVGPYLWNRNHWPCWCRNLSHCIYWIHSLRCYLWVHIVITHIIHIYNIILILLMVGMSHWTRLLIRKIMFLIVYRLLLLLGLIYCMLNMWLNWIWMIKLTILRIHIIKLLLWFIWLMMMYLFILILLLLIR